MNPLVWDSILAALIASIVGATVSSQDGVHGVVAWALVLVASAPLAVRRLAPLPVLGVVSGATIVLALVGNGGAGDTAVALAIYTVAAREPWRRVAMLGIPIAFVGALASQLAAQKHHNWIEVVFGLTIAVGLPVLIGRIVFDRRRRPVLDREPAAREAVALERTRIARELHDVVAHAMSVMIVQAGAARTVVERDPAAALTAVAEVEDTGRFGMAEMRRLIGVLKADGAGRAMRRSRARTARPVARDRPERRLARRVRERGHAAAASRRRRPHRVPRRARSTDQRAEARRRRACVVSATTRRARRWRSPTTAAGRRRRARPGHGLLGMRERVGVFGGTLETGARPGGGFVVRARIPSPRWVR